MRRRLVKLVSAFRNAARVRDGANRAVPTGCANFQSAALMRLTRLPGSTPNRNLLLRQSGGDRALP